MIGIPAVRTVSELLVDGMSRAAIEYACRSGKLVRVRRGVYCDADVWNRSAWVPADRHAIEVDAATRALRVKAWASGYSAAALLDLPVPKGQPEVVELTTVSSSRSQRSYPGLRVRTATCIDVDDLVIVRRVVSTSAALTCADVARAYGFAAGLVIADASLREGQASMSRLSSAGERMAGWPGAKHVRLVAEHASGSRESPGESVSFAAFVDAGIPFPECNPWLCAVGVGGLRPDFLWRLHRLVGEVDGFEKYREPRRYSDERVLLEEKKRQMRLEEAGLVVIRWTPAEVIKKPRVVLERIARHSAMAARMFGVPRIDID